MVDSILSYNDSTDILSYNCGSFALQIFEQDWYMPNAWVNAREDWFTIDEVDELAFECAEDVMREYPQWKMVNHYSEVPNDKTVIGFRLAHDEEYESGEVGLIDFHFITRINGCWYHKPGSWEIERLGKDFPADEPWMRSDGEAYNSAIVWMVKE